MSTVSDEGQKLIPVTAPMAGIVFKVSTKKGARVAKGDIVAMLEVMKMEIEITAPDNGIVKSVAVAQGQEVNMGDVLLQILPEE